MLFILHQTVKNRWAEITNVLLGRSDNSIKNYWNSTLLHKQGDFERDLKNYLKRVLSADQAWTDNPAAGASLSDVDYLANR